jgi:hypothetical protein
LIEEEIACRIHVQNATQHIEKRRNILTFNALPVARGDACEMVRTVFVRSVRSAYSFTPGDIPSASMTLADRT